ARMRIGRSTSVGSIERASDIFDAPRRSALAHGSQVIKRMDPAVMAVIPIEPDRVVAYAHDLARAHISPHRLGIEQLASAHLLDAEGAMTRQAQVADVEVIAMTVLPEHGQGTRIAAAQTDGGVA